MNSALGYYGQCNIFRLCFLFPFDFFFFLCINVLYFYKYEDVQCVFQRYISIELQQAWENIDLNVSCV